VVASIIKWEEHMPKDSSANDSRIINLKFFEDFIAKYYTKQHPVIRGFVFLLFSLLVFYAGYQMIGGEVLISGRIYHSIQGPVPGGRPLIKGAKQYDIVFGGKAYGPNHRGDYFLILSSVEYAKLLVSGQLDVDLSIGSASHPPQKLSFNRIKKTFEDIAVSPPAEGGSAHAQPATLERIGSSDPALGTLLAWADSEDRGNRLLVLGIDFKGADKAVREGFIELRDERTLPRPSLLKTRAGTVATIPLVAGEAVAPGSTYYFEVPKVALSPSAQVKLSSKGWFLSTDLETFSLPERPPVGQPFPARGTKGSELYLLLLSPYDVVLYDKKDMADVKDQLKKALTDNGYLVLESPSPLGESAQTNAIFGGRRVPFTVLQSILGIAARYQLLIKKVEYQLNLRSGNPYEVQLGGLAELNRAPAMSRSKIERILRAKDEAEFRSALEE
jgi:hypothetical protein